MLFNEQADARARMLRRKWFDDPINAPSPKRRRRRGSSVFDSVITAVFVLVLAFLFGVLMEPVLRMSASMLENLSLIEWRFRFGPGKINSDFFDPNASPFSISLQSQDFQLLAFKAKETASHGQVITGKYLNNLEPHREISIFWVSPRGNEKSQGTAKPGGYVTIKTFVGHLFVVRDRRSNEYIRSFVVEQSHGGTVKVPLYSSKYEEMKEAYLQRTGSQWLPAYPSMPIVHKMLDSKSITEWKKPLNRGDQQLTVTAVQESPRSFKIDSFGSHQDCESIAGLLEKDSRIVSVDPFRIEALERISQQMLELIGVTASKENVRMVMENVDIVSTSAGNSPDFFVSDVLNPADEHNWGRHDLFRGRNRFLTAFLVLTGDHTGGDIVFPAAEHRSEHVQDFCKGLEFHDRKTQPGKGDLVLLYDMLEDGNLDKDSYYGICPVTKNKMIFARFRIWNPLQEFFK